MTIELEIEGMTCQHCARRVREALEGVPGARAARVDHEAGRGSVETDDDVELAPFLAAVRDAGYQARKADEEAGR